MKRILSAILVFIGLCSFGQNKIESKQQLTNTIKLDLFNSLPPIIDGCSGLYTYDSITLKKEKYIFISNLQDLAIIKVNNVDISLKLVSNKELTKNSNKFIYEGKGYKAILITKILKQEGEELTVVSGTLTIFYGNTSVTLKIHGEEGC